MTEKVENRSKRRTSGASMEAGAMGYLVKGMSHGVLMEALRRVYAGRRFVPLPMTRSPASGSSESDLSGE
jgi:DNA-binding NarL/FixJ family response regulator